MPYRFLRYPEGKCKAVTFSYDDGSCHDLRMLETLNRYGIKCTFNLCSSLIGPSDRLSVEQINTLISQGHEAAVHTATHLANGIISPAEGIREVLICREEMEKMLGRIVRGMAYPDSGITRFSDMTDYETVRGYLKNLGIAYSRTLGGDNNKFELPTDWYAWMPTAHHKNPKIFEYIDEFLSIDLNTLYGARRCSRLFYLWGHSREFEANQNWDLLERICEKLGQKDDIWYANNIEIYDYVAAYNSLIWSADSKIVYNPTVKTVWFSYDNTTYKIEPSQTLKL